MDQLRRQGEGVSPRRQAFGAVGTSHPRSCKNAIAILRLASSSPLVDLLQAQDSLGLAIVLVGIDVEDVLARSRQGTSRDEAGQSVWRAKAKPMESEAYRARRDCWSPVPLITTSHFVSERDSMVRSKEDGERKKKEEEKQKRSRKK